MMEKFSPMAVSITEAAKTSGVGRTSIYKAVGRGEIPLRKHGRRSLILVNDLQQWLEKMPLVNGSVSAAR